MEKISPSVFGLDKRNRFVGVVTKRGEVLDGGFHENVEPLLDLHKEQHIYLYP